MMYHLLLFSFGRWLKWTKGETLHPSVPYLSSMTVSCEGYKKPKKWACSRQGYQIWLVGYFFLWRPQFSTNFDKNHTRRSFEPITKIDEVKFDLTGL